ncbi:REF/SRPP-like protein [Tanacetum coccineum]
MIDKPKKKRIRVSHESNSTTKISKAEFPMTCHNYGQAGHNKKGCKNDPILKPPKVKRKAGRPKKRMPSENTNVVGDEDLPRRNWNKNKRGGKLASSCFVKMRGGKSSRESAFIGSTSASPPVARHTMTEPAAQELPATQEPQLGKPQKIKNQQAHLLPPREISKRILLRKIFITIKGPGSSVDNAIVIEYKLFNLLLVLLFPPKSHMADTDVPVTTQPEVDESVTKFDSRVPPFVKQVSTTTKSLSTKASEVKSAGVVETASGLAKTAYTKLEPTAKGLYTKYEPVAEQYAASAWHSLNQLPYFPQVANVVVPKAAYFSEKYNQTVQETAEKGYKVSSYLPLVPTERIAKVFNSAEPQAEPVVSSGTEGVVAAH